MKITETLSVAILAVSSISQIDIKWLSESVKHVSRGLLFEL